MHPMKLLLALALVVGGCCPHAPTETLVVNTAEIRANPDGTYTVTDGWMMARLKYEQGLLEKCR